MDPPLKLTRRRTDWFKLAGERGATEWLPWAIELTALAEAFSWFRYPQGVYQIGGKSSAVGVKYPRGYWGEKNFGRFCQFYGGQLDGG